MCHSIDLHPHTLSTASCEWSTAVDRENSFSRTIHDALRAMHVQCIHAHIFHHLQRNQVCTVQDKQPISPAAVTSFKTCSCHQTSNATPLNAVRGARGVRFDGHGCVDRYLALRVAAPCTSRLLVLRAGDSIVVNPNIRQGRGYCCNVSVKPADHQRFQQLPHALLLLLQHALTKCYEMEQHGTNPVRVRDVSGERFASTMRVECASVYRWRGPDGRH